ncbi:MAG: cation/multidrug efflux pump [Candidatus Tectomicrobia bacterium]|nr:cation/multidrug efflux pump [Candidatus Tectomicrobia bacterium]
MTLEVFSIALAALGLLALGGALRQLWRRRLLAGSAQGSAGILLLAVATLSWALLANLHTYRRLTHEQLAADLSFTALGPQFYQARLTDAAGFATFFELHGDEWQLDARILKWRGLVNLVGIHTLYRLERLSGRYRDAAQAAATLPSVQPLARHAGLDAWRLAQRFSGWLPWVDADYGSATYMPMADGARYAVLVSTSGLIARPRDAATRKVVEGWR